MNPAGQIDGKIEAEGELYLSKEFWKRLEEIFSESPIFDDLERILQEPEPLDWYNIREFPLDAARDNEMIMNFPEQGGDIVLVISYTGKAEIKFDNVNSDSFDLETYSKIRHTYTNIYLSNEAQSGDTIKILFGRGDWEITDAITEIDLSGAIRNDQLDPITDPLKIGQIIRNSHIVPHADIACEKILISGATRLDQWRSADDYTYMDPGRILLHAAATLSDWRHPTDLTLINGGQIFTHSIEANRLSILTHILTGAIWRDDFPVAGWVEWTNAQITYNGHTYDIADGSTSQLLPYIWWDLDDPTNFQTAAVKPAPPLFTDDDCIVCYNDAGTHELVWNATLIEGRTIRTGSITTDEIMANTILAGNIAAGTITTDEIAAFTIVAGDIAANTITAGKLNITDLIDIANRMTLAAGRVVIDKDAFGADLEGIIINDGAWNRVEIGELTLGNYGMVLRDSAGKTTVDMGELQNIWHKIYDEILTANATNINVIGLHGDTAEFYKIVFFGVCGANFGVVRGQDLRFNADNGNNYGFVYVLSDNGALSGGQDNNTDHIYVQDFAANSLGYTGFTEMDIYALSGRRRLSYSVVSSRGRLGAQIDRSATVAGIWNNTAAEITQMNFYSNGVDAFGPGTHICIYERI